jgi:hypothetical protein
MESQGEFRRQQLYCAVVGGDHLQGPLKCNTNEICGYALSFPSMYSTTLVGWIFFISLGQANLSPLQFFFFPSNILMHSYITEAMYDVNLSAQQMSAYMTTMTSGNRSRIRLLWNL